MNQQHRVINPENWKLSKFHFLSQYEVLGIPLRKALWVPLITVPEYTVFAAGEVTEESERAVRKSARRPHRPS